MIQQKEPMVPAALGYLYPRAIIRINAGRVLAGNDPMGSYHHFPVPIPPLHVQYYKNRSKLWKQLPKHKRKEKAIEVGLLPRMRRYVPYFLGVPEPKDSQKGVDFCPKPSIEWYRYLYALRQKDPRKNPYEAIHNAFRKIGTPLVSIKSKSGKSRRTRVTFGTKRYRNIKLLRGKSFKAAVQFLQDPTPVVSILKRERKLIIKK